jgi:hypothetical protein
MIRKKRKSDARRDTLTVSGAPSQRKKSTMFDLSPASSAALLIGNAYRMAASGGLQDKTTPIRRRMRRCESADESSGCYVIAC